MDTELYSERIQVERKQFFFDLKENPRGRFLKITEDVGGRRDTIIIPATGLNLFAEAVEKTLEASGRIEQTVESRPPAEQKAEPSPEPPSGEDGE